MDLEKLPLDVQEVLKKFTKICKERYNPLGILLVGSYAKGYAGTHSDLDVQIIVPDQDWRERGNTWIDGIEIEYFINPIRQIRAYLRDEDGLRPNTADMLATGIILYQIDPVIDDLVETARKILDDGKPLEGDELEIARYSLDDIEKDLRDLKDRPKTLAYQKTAWLAINSCIRIFLRHHQTYQERVKILSDQLRQLDPEFAGLIDDAITKELSFDVLIDLIQYTENLIGGKRPDEWRLRGNLKL